MSTLVAPNVNSIKQGDTEPLVAVLTDLSGPVNVEGTVVLFRMRPKFAGRGHAAFSGSCVLVQARDLLGKITNRGKVEYVWGAGQTDVPGTYECEWVVTLVDGKQRTFPNDRRVTLEILPAAT